MLKRTFAFFAILLFVFRAHAQLGPEITSWIQNTTATGYGGIVTNVQLVQYNSANVYVSASCLPSYNIGPWPTDPNVPINQNFVFAITRNPVPNTGTLTAVPLGHTGIWKNGVSIFNSEDAQSYMNLGYWHQDAYVFEGVSFDSCLGHPAPNGEYHHHVSPKCLYDIEDSAHHSPLIGFAFDGYPVYGAYGYTNTNGTGSIKRMRSSYEKRSITQRHTLPNGQTLSSTNWGPDVSTTYPLGSYVEDYNYVAGSGDLDSNNGRWCITPEYPTGTYCYFVTLDASLLPQYPYTLGLHYYGTVQSGNTGPTSGHNTVPTGTTVYTTGVEEILKEKFAAKIYPSPASTYLSLFIEPIATNNFTATLTDESGRIALTQDNVQPAVQYTFDVSSLPAGIYLMRIKNTLVTYTHKVVVLR